MARYAAFLRGVNLGPNRRVSNDALRSALEDMDFTGVTPFRSSGNVVFDAGRKSPAKLTGVVEDGLSEAFGFDVAIFLRTEDELRAIAEHDPFPGELVEASDGKLQVDLLKDPPGTGVRKDVLALATDEDRLAFGGRELYWLPSGRMVESTLDLNAIQKLVGPTTRRTMGTIEQIASKCFEDYR